MEETDEQTINSRPWLFKKGQSGNPGGRPKGTISLKEYAKKHLRELNDEQKLEFLEGIEKHKVWEMGEGKAQASTDITTLGKALPTPILGSITNEVQEDHSSRQDTETKEAA